MKKIYSICLAALLGGLTQVSCTSDEYTEIASSVKVIEAQTDLPVSGGSTTLIVTSGEVLDIHQVKNVYGDSTLPADEDVQRELTAQAADQWLDVKVDGNIITVSADANDGLLTRHTVVTVTGANGDQALINVSQAGLVIVNEAEQTYLFDADDIEGTEFFDMSNVDYNFTISDEWIHVEKSENGYTITVDKNTGAYRKGMITLRYREVLNKTINVGQWGEELPPFVGHHTATYEDESGNSYTKEVEIVENGTNAYLIKNLVDEGDIAFSLNPNTNGTSSEWYIAAGYLIGTRTEGSTTLRLRCILSTYTTATGNRYYPTANTSLASNSYRIALGWTTDDAANLVFGTKRNTSLSASYLTDGFIVCSYSNATSLANTFRRDIAYQFLNLRFE